MIKIGILGDIGSGKSYVANNFGYPVFDADHEVSELYKKDQKIFKKLKKKLPKYINSFPIKKKELKNAVLAKKKNLKKIENIIHPEVQKNIKEFIKINKDKKILVFDIPLLLEKKIYNKKNMKLVFVEAKKKDIIKKLKKRKNYDEKIIKEFRSLQLPLEFKKKKSNYIVKNNFKRLNLKKHVKILKEKILGIND